MGHAYAQRADENAVQEADDAFGTVVGDEEIGLYRADRARGFSPIRAGNLRINGLYFDQGSQFASPNTRIQRGSSIHVGISAQGYPLPSPTGVVDYDLRLPGDEFITSVKGELGALFSYPRYETEIDTQFPVVKDELRIGMGLGLRKNNAHQNAVKNHRYNGGLIAHWTPNETMSVIPFWSFERTDSGGGQRPKIFIGENEAPEFRAKDLYSPEWVYFGARHYNYGLLGEWRLQNQWVLRSGIFHSESNNPEGFSAFLLNTDAQGTGDYVIQAVTPQNTQSTSGEIRLAKTFQENGRHHTFYLTTRARDRSDTFGGNASMNFGRATIGDFPDLPQPDLKTTATGLTETRQVTGGVSYNGIWRNVGQLSLALQKTNYEQTLTRPNTSPVKGTQSPWLYNVAASVILTPRLTAYTGYTRGLEELGSAPENAVNRDEAVPAQLTRQIDAGLRYQFRPDLSLVAGVFQIDKPYYGLDQTNVFRRLGDVRHSGVELSLTGTLADSLTVVAGAIFLNPKITDPGTNGVVSKFTSVSAIPRRFRVNMQYRPPAWDGFAFDAIFRGVSSRYLRISNTFRTPSTYMIDLGARYTTTISDMPVRVRLQVNNLMNKSGVSPSSSGQISPYQARRTVLSVAADF